MSVIFKSLQKMTGDHAAGNAGRPAAPAISWWGRYRFLVLLVMCLVLFLGGLGLAVPWGLKHLRPKLQSATSKALPVLSAGPQPDYLAPGEAPEESETPSFLVPPSQVAVTPATQAEAVFQAKSASPPPAGLPATGPSEPDAAKPDPVEPPQRFASRAKAPVGAAQSLVIIETDRVTSPAPSATPPVGAAPPRRVTPAETRRRQMADLVTQLQTAIQNKDAGRSDALLTQLAALRGAQDPFTLKMQAYWCLQKEDYNGARGFLLPVLAANADDLEAGLNMAVVEIRTHQTRQAHARLLKLRDLYPENGDVISMLQQFRQSE